MTELQGEICWNHTVRTGSSNRLMEMSSRSAVRVKFADAWSLVSLFLLAIVQLAATAPRLLFVPEERYSVNYFWAFRRLLRGDYFANSNVADSGPLAIAQGPLFPLENLSLVAWNAPIAAVQSVIGDPAPTLIIAVGARHVISMIAVYFVLRVFSSPFVAFLLAALASTTEAIYLGFAFTQNTAGVVGLAFAVQGTFALARGASRRGLILLISYPVVGIGTWVNLTSAVVYSLLGLTLTSIILIAYHSPLRHYVKVWAFIGAPLLTVLLFAIVQVSSSRAASDAWSLWTGRNANPLIVATGFGKWSMLDAACFQGTSVCLPYEPFAEVLTQTPFILVRWLLLITVVLIGVTLVVSPRTRAHRQDTHDKVNVPSVFILLLLSTGFLYIASFIGYFDQYWQLRDAFPIVLDAWREPWAKWSPAYVMTGLCLSGLVITQTHSVVSPWLGRTLIALTSVIVLFLVLPTLRPVAPVQGLQAPTPKDLDEVVNEAHALVELLPNTPVCVGNINGRQDLTQLTGMVLADRRVSVVFATPDRVCSDLGLPVVLLNRDYPDEIWTPFYGQDTYREDFTPVAQGRHMALLLPNS